VLPSPASVYGNNCLITSILLPRWCYRRLHLPRGPYTGTPRGLELTYLEASQTVLLQGPSRLPAFWHRAPYQRGGVPLTIVAIFLAGYPMPVAKAANLSAIMAHIRGGSARERESMSIQQAACIRPVKLAGVLSNWHSK